MKIKITFKTCDPCTFEPAGIDFEKDHVVIVIGHKEIPYPRNIIQKIEITDI